MSAIIRIIISENTNDYISTKKFTTIVENQSTERAMVAMHTHASNRIREKALSINNTEILT
jgi:hypothetical protein